MQQDQIQGMGQIGTKYELIEQISEWIYKAYDNAEQKYVAIKQNVNSTEVIKQSISNCKSSPHIVQYYGYTADYLIMELCDSNLKTYWETVSIGLNQVDRIRMALEVGNQIKIGYGQLLQRFNGKFIHRNLKPENILCHDSFIKISDYGLYVDNMGNCVFSAPEITQHYCDNRCDVYSFGMILYWMIYGDCHINLHLILLSPLKQFFNSLLELDPTKRITWHELLVHKIFRTPIEDGQIQIEEVDSKEFSMIIPCKLNSQSMPNRPVTVSHHANFQSEHQSLPPDQLLHVNRVFKECLQEIDINQKGTTSVESRLLFIFWIQVIDSELKRETDKDKRIGIVEVKKVLQNQQLIRLCQQSSHQVEFMDQNDQLTLIKRIRFRSKTLNKQFRDLIRLYFE